MEKKITIKRDYNGHIIYSKVCEICEVEFWAKKNDGKCCSNSCRSLKCIRNKRIV